jgi:hypothetical protein
MLRKRADEEILDILRRKLPPTIFESHKKHIDTVRRFSISYDDYLAFLKDYVLINFGDVTELGSLPKN